MAIDEVLLNQAYDLWHDFKNTIIYKNRYIVKHQILGYLESFTKKNQNKKTIAKGEILYRARKYNIIDPRIEALNRGAYRGKVFWGYDEKDSFVPTNNDSINNGRANPAFIKYLYA